VVGCGQLGDEPWEGTSALRWVEVELPAPAREGIANWSARLRSVDEGMPHAEATARFSLAAVQPPNCRLSITFTDSETDAPIENANIRLGPFRAVTDERGRAELFLAAGTYEVSVWHPGFEAPPCTLVVDGNLTLQLAGSAVTQEDPSARWMM
jgi:hypothetical protein